MNKIIIKTNITFIILMFIASTVLLSLSSSFKAYANSAVTISSTDQTGINDSSITNGSNFQNTNNTLLFGQNGTSPVNNFILFEGLNISQGSVINNANINFKITNSGGSIANVQIYAQSIGNATRPLNLSDFLLKQSQLTTNNTSWNNIPSGTWGTSILTPSISPIIQEITNRSDWQSGNSILIWIGENSSSPYSSRSVGSADISDPTMKPILNITFGSSSVITPTLTPTPIITTTPTSQTPTPTQILTPTPTPTNPPSSVTTTTLQSNLTNGLDDTSITNASNFDATSNELVLGQNGTSPVNNFLLFRNIVIPQGVTIVDSKLNLVMTNGGQPNTNVLLRASNSSNPVSPTSLSQFLSLQSQLTTSNVSWNNIINGSWGTKLVSPSITNVVQEIINRSDWKSGSSILIWVGENNSSAYSARKVGSGDISDSTLKPVLNISYQGTAPSTTPTPTPSITPTQPVPTITPTQTSVPTPTPTSVPTITPAPKGTYKISFAANTTQVPSNINYSELTYKVTIGSALSVNAKVDGVTFPITYDSNSGIAILTTTGHNVEINAVNPLYPSLFKVEKAALKYNKNWAWSHGMDDNEYLKAQIDLFNAVGWRASLFLIGSYISDTRNESWIVDAPYIQNLLNNGWSIGNHTWDHDCSQTATASELQTTVDMGYSRLQQVIAGSTRQNYKLNAFAAPCFLSGYDPIISAKRTTTDVKFEESGSDSMKLVDSLVSGQSYTNGNLSAKSMDFNTIIGREVNLQSDSSVGITDMDWADANSNASRHIWFNSLSHGNAESYLSPIIQHAYNTYGPKGTNTLWVAPSDEIYDYLLVRQNTNLSSPVVTKIN